MTFHSQIVVSSLGSYSQAKKLADSYVIRATKEVMALAVESHFDFGSEEALVLRIQDLVREFFESQGQNLQGFGFEDRIASCTQTIANNLLLEFRQKSAMYLEELQKRDEQAGLFLELPFFESAWMVAQADFAQKTQSNAFLLLQDKIKPLIVAEISKETERPINPPENVRTRFQAAVEALAVRGRTFFSRCRI